MISKRTLEKWRKEALKIQSIERQEKACWRSQAD
jgi:hypothetical protein